MWYQLWRHMKSGEVWAVKLDDQGETIAACGPLNQHEALVGITVLHHFDYDRGDDLPVTHPEQFDLWEPEGWQWCDINYQPIKTITRTRSLRIRVSDNEHAALSRNAEEAGQKISAYIRDRCCK